MGSMMCRLGKHAWYTIHLKSGTFTECFYCGKQPKKKRGKK